MTRKDYIKFADAITYAGELVENGTIYNAQAALFFMRSAIAEILAADNPRFDRNRFTAAAKVPAHNLLGGN